MQPPFIIASTLISVLFASHAESIPAAVEAFLPPPLPPTPLKQFDDSHIGPNQFIRRQADHNEQNAAPTTMHKVEESTKKEHEDQQQAKQTIAAHTSTNDNDETVVINVTTVVVVAAGGSTPNPNNQVLHSPVETPADQNEETTFENQLQDDQEALHRTALILALVGGLIGIAIVASIVIFTKMRIRKRKLSQDQDGGESQSGDNDFSSNNSNSNSDDIEHSNSNWDNSSIHQRPLTRQHTDDEQSISNSRPPLLLQPSAPPSDEVQPHNSSSARTLNRRRVVSMGSQMAPAPSAPTAKELDAANNCSNSDDYSDMPVLYPMRPPADNEGSSSTHHHQQQQQHHPSSSSSSTTCPHCFEYTSSSPSVPEAPPPAYTPTAPPLYALPPLPDHICHHPPSTSSASSISSATNTVNDLLLPSRNIAS